MRTAILSPCYLAGKDPIGNDRLERNVRYVDYYLHPTVRDALGVHALVLYDNASPTELVGRFLDSVGRKPEIVFTRAETELKRGSGPHDYPYCWRALYHGLRLFEEGFEKVLFIDSDSFVLTHELANYLRWFHSGWVSFWCESGEHPESSIHAVSRYGNGLGAFQFYCKTPWEKRVGTMMEHDLPFTHVSRMFRVSRWGERGAPPQDRTMDCYLQAPLTVELEFGRFR